MRRSDAVASLGRDGRDVRRGRRGRVRQVVDVLLSGCPIEGMCCHGDRCGRLAAGVYICVYGVFVGCMCDCVCV